MSDLEPIEVIGALVLAASLVAIGFAAGRRSEADVSRPLQGATHHAGTIMAEPLPFPDNVCLSAQALNEAWIARRRGLEK